MLVIRTVIKTFTGGTEFGKEFHFRPHNSLPFYNQLETVYNIECYDFDA